KALPGPVARVREHLGAARIAVSVDARVAVAKLRKRCAVGTAQRRVVRALEDQTPVVVVEAGIGAEWHGAPLLHLALLVPIIKEGDPGQAELDAGRRAQHALAAAVAA